MKFLNLIMLSVVLTSSTTIAQEKTKSFDFKKGEVLDIILLSQTENADVLFERYKKTVFPVGFVYLSTPIWVWYF